jgi:hypothetical protein
MNAPLTAHPTPPYKHTPLFPLGKDQTPYRKSMFIVRLAAPCAWVWSAC